MIAIIENELCGFCADLVYRLEQNEFKPIGGIKLTDDQFYALLLDCEAPFLNFKMLRPPHHKSFEYSY